jgi:hypothetical protein
MRELLAWAALLAAGCVLGIAVDARAAQYQGWGDTGWVYASKRDCCNSAIAIAQEYSMNACVTSGGVPRPTTGMRRGNCQWDWTQDGAGNMLYRCYGEAAVWCR